MSETHSDSPIRNIPSIKKTQDSIQNLAQLKALAPVLQLFGADTTAFEKDLEKVDDLERQMEEFARVPDRFNELFVERGWIIYDLMDIEVAKAAITKAETGDIDGAEADLIAHYDTDAIQWRLRAIQKVQAFQPRMRLAKKALEDYQAERYHACVPVVLALIDGMVSEVHQKAHGYRRSFSAEDVNLKAWDSLAAHSRGLMRLVRIMHEGRHKTSTDSTSIPYRNGIMHGVDLNYDNREVAAKTWATLFAACDWATKVEQGQAHPPPEEPKQTLQEQWSDIGHSLQRVQESKNEQERHAQWKAREMQLGKDIPRTGPPEAFTVGTPEYRLAEYLAYWKKRNYGRMAQCLSQFLGSAMKSPVEVRMALDSKRLLTFEFMSIQDKAPAVTEIETEVVYMEDDGEVRKSHLFRMMSTDTKGTASMPKLEGTAWGLIPWQIW